jgi:uncharacterized membrane protein YdjX (TVP38/TMEM64 family)
LAGALLLLFLAVAFWQIDWESRILPVIAWFDRLGFWGPLLFVLLYMVATVILFPPSILSLGAGAIFGFLKGALLVIIGATLGLALYFSRLSRRALAQRIREEEEQ